MQETIAVVFDFDDTLAPDTTSGYLRKQGVDLGRFWPGVNALCAEDWDPAPAYLHQMLQLGTAGTIPLRRDDLIAWGREAPLHAGTDTLFTRLRQTAENTNPTVALEFYVISSGIGDIVRSTRIAEHFKDIWASEFHYDAEGRAAFPKKIISFTDKTRYLFHIQKGLIGRPARGKPLEVNKRVEPDQLRIPFSNMIFVGDGLTDVPCFSLLAKEKGMAVAVYDSQHMQKWDNAYQFVADRRVAALHSANFSEGSDLSNFLTMAVRNLAERIAVAKAAYRP